MKVVVLIKRVPDTASVFKIAADNRSVEKADLKFVLGPYDEHALEEAIKAKETGRADEVIVVSMGAEGTQETIRKALAMGADRAILVKVEDPDALGSRGVAVALTAALKSEAPELIFAGKQAVDDDASQVPERLAELMNIPHASVITKFELEGDVATVEREIEGGHYSYDVRLPALFTTQKGINTPRYPKLPDIMKAKKKELREVSLEDLGLNEADVASGVRVEQMSLPRQERLNKVLEGDTGERVQQLLSILREDEKVL